MLLPDHFGQVQDADKCHQNENDLFRNNRTSLEDFKEKNDDEAEEDGAKVHGRPKSHSLDGTVSPGKEDRKQVIEEDPRHESEEETHSQLGRAAMDADGRSPCKEEEKVKQTNQEIEAIVLLAILRGGVADVDFVEVRNGAQVETNSHKQEDKQPPSLKPDSPGV